MTDNMIGDQVRMAAYACSDIQSRAAWDIDVDYDSGPTCEECGDRTDESGYDEDDDCYYCTDCQE